MNAEQIDQWRLCHAECRCDGDLHYTSGPHCCECDTPMPCGIHILADEVQRLTADVASWKSERDYLCNEVDALTAERDALKGHVDVTLAEANRSLASWVARAEAAEAWIAAAQAIHSPTDTVSGDIVCAVCVGNQGAWVGYPCPTVRALSGEEA